MTLFLCVFTSAFGSDYYNLDWPISSEVIRYHRCGCGDSCWVADLMVKKTHQIKLSLSCDCEKLNLSIGSSKEKKVIGPNCNEFNVDELNGKSNAIVKKIKSLKHHLKNNNFNQEYQLFLSHH